MIQVLSSLKTQLMLLPELLSYWGSWLLVMMTNPQTATGLSEDIITGPFLAQLQQRELILIFFFLFCKSSARLISPFFLSLSFLTDLGMSMIFNYGGSRINLQGRNLLLVILKIEKGERESPISNNE